MPNITAAGDYNKDKPGFEFLEYSTGGCCLVFSGATLPTTLTVGIINDVGAYVPLTGGTVTVLPSSLMIPCIPQGGLVIQVTGGTPSFNVSAGGRT